METNAPRSISEPIISTPMMNSLDKMEDYDRLAKLCEKLADELSAMKQRAEAAEARIREAQEQEPVAWFNARCAGNYEWNSKYDPRQCPQLYAAPIPPVDISELQREKAELTRKLAEENNLKNLYRGELEQTAGQRDELSKLLAEAKSKAVPEFSTFNEWMHKEIPSGTIIGDAGWWASRIYRKFIAPSATQPETDRGSNE